MSPAVIVVQANLYNTGPVTDLVLVSRVEVGVDVLAIQEPWAGRVGERWVAKTHSYYELIVLDTFPEERPRALLYVKKGARVTLV